MTDSLPPILVTGAHRSGTTWVGKMLAAGPDIAYISEPLNRLHRPGVMRQPVERWYPYLCAENEADYLPALQQTLRFHYGLWAELKSLRSFKDAGRMGRDLSIFLNGRLGRQRPLLKDPFAVFSAPWFADRLGARVAITVRHPAAFASSLKWLGWNFDFRDLLVQPLLMRDLLEPYRQAMEAMLLHPQDVIGQSCLLWRVVYETVDQFKRDHPDFIIVRHEDLSLTPLESYQRLYAELNLPFSPPVRRVIENSSSPDNPQKLSKSSVHSVRLDSRASLKNWKKRLEPEEIARIRELTGEAARRFYQPEDWE